MRQVVGVSDEKRLVPKECPIGPDRAAGAQQLGLVYESDTVTPARICNVSAHLVGQIMRVYERALDACLEQKVKPIVEQRPVVDGDEALRDGFSDRPEAGSHAGGQQKRSHSSFQTQTEMVSMGSSVAVYSTCMSISVVRSASESGAFPTRDT